VLKFATKRVRECGEREKERQRERERDIYINTAKDTLTSFGDLFPQLYANGSARAESKCCVSLYVSVRVYVCESSSELENYTIT